MARCSYVCANFICYRNKGAIQNLQEREATKVEIIKEQNELITRQRSELAAIIAEVEKLKEVVKQQESDIKQKMEQEVKHTAEKTELQGERSVLKECRKD